MVTSNFSACHQYKETVKVYHVPEQSLPIVVHKFWRYQPATTRKLTYWNSACIHGYRKVNADGAAEFVKKLGHNDGEGFYKPSASCIECYPDIACTNCKLRPRYKEAVVSHSAEFRQRVLVETGEDIRNLCRRCINDRLDPNEKRCEVQLHHVFLAHEHLSRGTFSIQIQKS